MNFFEQQPLQKYNSLALRQTARYAVTVTTEAELLEALTFASNKQLPYWILGEGSNVVISSDLDGLVIFNRITGISLQQQDTTSACLHVGAGEHWHDFVAYTLQHDWPGLENLALIPGTVGAAPVQNIGAYGVEASEFIANVHAYDTHLQQWVDLDRTACRFAYRDSLFKHQAKRYLITRVDFCLSRNAAVNTNYPALQQQLLDQGITPSKATPGQVFDAVIQVRQQRLPDPKQQPNAGSFFKNPLVPIAQEKQLRISYPGLVSYPAEPGRRKLAAAWLIDHAGWKGKRVGNVAVHDRQALVLVNSGGATGKEILEVASMVQDDIRAIYGVDLQLEPDVL